MERILVDANALISFVTDRNLSQQKQIDLLLKQATRGDYELILHQHALTEMIFVLKNLYRIQTNIVAKMMDDLVHQPGTATSNDLDWEDVLKLWPSKVSDLGDAILASAALTNHWKVATFDKSFQNQLNVLKIPLALSRS